MKISKLKTVFYFITAAFSFSAMADTRSFQESAVEIDGTKFWLPSVIVVKKGDTVKIHLISKVPGQNSVHGFAIDGYKISEVVDTKGKDIEFKTDQAGIFPIYCQLHPAHIGGQLVVE